MRIEDDRIVMRRPDDFHVHLREGRTLHDLAPYTAKVFQRALIMPNVAVHGPIIYSGEAARYYAEVINALKDHGIRDFVPLMTVQITEKTVPLMVLQARTYGVKAGKIYPRGMTTNSENGVLDYEKIYPALEAMQACGMVACFHGESPDPAVDPIDREYRFLETLLKISKTFPKLKIVLEHITDSSSVRWVSQIENVAATITVHHLLITMTDWHGRKLSPHLFCKPEAKRFKDRAAMLAAVFSGNPKFFLGTDSAPHPRYQKECAECCSGIFTAPVALSLLAQLFEQHHALERLEPFCSEFGARFYDLPLNEGEIVLERRDWTVPLEYHGVVPFRAGEVLPWQVVTA